MSTWKKSVPNRKELHRMKRESLLREAIAAFNDRGFSATSLDDIARNLDVTKAALYHYFPNKHAILYAAFDKALNVAFESLEKAETQGQTGLEKLQLTIQGYLEIALDELDRCLLLTEENALLAEHLAEIVPRRDKFEQTLRRFVLEGINDGSVIPCDPKLAIFVIWGAVNWVPKWYSHGGPWRSDQIAHSLAEMACRAIARDPVDAMPRDVGAT